MEKVPLDNFNMSAGIGGIGITPSASKAYDEQEKIQFDEEAKGLTTSTESEKVLHNLPMQAYMHYAEIQREFERNKQYDELYEAQVEQIQSDPMSNLSLAKLDSQRMLRLAKAYAVFFLITTDILGPTNAPYAVAQMGYAPGVILYVLFGVAAAAGGYFLNFAFCKYDSNNYPIRTFADLSARAVASWFRYPFAALHFAQMILNCGALLLTAASGVAQMQVTNLGKNNLCFTVGMLVWAIFAMICGQIRKLSRFAFLANIAVWMNIAVCVITMVGAATGGPNYRIFSENYGYIAPYFNPLTQEPLPIQKVAIMSGSLSDRITGMNNMVFAWGGATIFCEVMAELKRPMDFWKGMLAAQCLILVIYLFFGLFVYSYFGQFSYVQANMGIVSKALQNAGNVVNLISVLLAAVLYGNIGIKVIYQGFLVPDFKFPKLTTTPGIIAWAIFVVIYWAIAYVLGTSIPSISTLVSIIGAFCIFNFSYTFPFLFTFLYLWRKDAGSRDDFDITTFTVTKYDTYRQASRWKRAMTLGGYKRTLAKLALFLLLLGSLATCGLCSYSAIEGAIATYQTNVAHPFSCPANV